MRCPKCGFISFDHMESCLKCKKDISGSTEVEGTTYHAEAPSFLRVPEKAASEPEFAPDETDSFDTNDDFAEDDYDFSDPELDVLVEEEDDDEEGAITFGGDESGDFLLEEDEESNEEGEFEFDLDEDLDLSGEEQTAPPALNVPDELADISDLAPPAVVEIPSPSAADEMNISLDDEMSLDEDLDLDGLDLDLGLGEKSDALDAELSLSLDDIELAAGDITEENSDLDELSMDLDLDGFDEKPAPEKEKSSGSLDGISLSLD